MSWIGEPLNGAEALYVEGKVDNKLIAHRGGLLGLVTLTLDPRDSLAMDGNRHPITEAGFGFIIEEMRRNLDRALQHGEFELIQTSDATFDGRPATLVEGKFTPHGSRKYYASRMIIYIDKGLLLPVANFFYDERDVLFEKYTFTDVQLNPGSRPWIFPDTMKHIDSDRKVSVTRRQFFEEHVAASRTPKNGGQRNGDGYGQIDENQDQEQGKNEQRQHGMTLLKGSNGRCRRRQTGKSKQHAYRPSLPNDDF